MFEWRVFSNGLWYVEGPDGRLYGVIRDGTGYLRKGDAERRMHQLMVEEAFRKGWGKVSLKAAKTASRWDRAWSGE